MNFIINQNNTSPQLKYVQGQTVSVTMISDDNQALVVYNQDTYSLSSTVKYVAFGIGGLGLFVSFLALIGGRLIGLETVAIIQITFFSLITLDKMSPTVSALSGLGLSCGYNKLQNYDISQKIEVPFKGIEWDASFLLNFNIMSLFVILPLLISLIAKILIKCNVKKYQNIITLI